jgi:hypothetical protein
MLYLGSQRPVELCKNAWLSIESLQEEARAVRRHVQRDHIYFVGAHTGCSCGFPHVIAETEIAYFDGLFDDQSPGRESDLASVRELLTVIDKVLEHHPDCVLLPVWNGEEVAEPKGEVRWDRRTMSIETFILTEGFRYTVHGVPFPNS